MFNKKIIPLIFVLIFNLWIWRIFNYSFFIGLLVVIASISLYLKKFRLSLLLIILLLFAQYKTSSINSLIFLNENEQIQQIQRLHAYRNIGFVPIANWLELRPETIAFYKIQQNLAEVVDPNLYFFANHPRERGGVVEYEKFAYILLPFFVLGIFLIEKRDLKYLGLGLAPFIVISVIGNSNPMGPFSLFPIITSLIAISLVPVFAKKKYFLPFLLIFSLVFIQTIAYANY